MFVRGSAATSTRYDLIVLADGTLQLRRLVNAVPTVLAQAPSGIADRGSFTTLTLAAQGAGRVALTGSVNGVPLVSATDASAAAIGAAGQAGLWTYTAGVRFDDFVIRSVQ